MDFKMADTSERRVFCNTILLKYHDYHKNMCKILIWFGLCAHEIKKRGQKKVMENFEEKKTLKKIFSGSLH